MGLEQVTLDGLWKKRRLFLFPRRATIETIFGCNCHCRMCPIDLPTTREKAVMPMELFTGIIDSLVPHKEHFEMMDLFGMGEPLLDPHIMERLKYVKAKGFKNVAFATNVDLLDADKQQRLLETGIDTVLFGIDGIDKETHEQIRRGATFERVVSNALAMIKRRNEGNYRTRFVVRFVRQDLNRTQWEAFKQFWRTKVSFERRDFITCYDAHTWGGEVSSKDLTLGQSFRRPEVEKMPCDIIFDILYVLSDGSVLLCHEDWHRGANVFGNVKDRPALDIFNDEKFNKIRDLHLAGKKHTMTMCKECTCLYSDMTKEVVDA